MHLSFGPARWPRLLSALLLLLSWMLVAAPPTAPVAASPPARDDGLAPARQLSPAELAYWRSKQPQTLRERWAAEMSPMGALAAGVLENGDPDLAPAVRTAPRWPRVPTTVGGTDVRVHSANAMGAQSETSIAINADGSVLIAGYNDARGFSGTPVTLSGIARSTDGGATWAEVPVGPGGAGRLPVTGSDQLFGDPDVKYDPVNDRFIYASILVRGSDGVQGMSVHVSNADGSVWNGPFQVTPAFISGQSADKEFIDVNPVTGRIMMTWTQFSASTTKILASYSDDGGQTWSPAATLTTAAAGGGVQSSVPRFLPGTDNATSQVYVTWRISNSGNTRAIGAIRSLDGGQTWQPAITLTANAFAAEDQILGVDRVNTSPSMAIDYTSGRVYVVYQSNNSVGEGDIALRTFIGAPTSGTPILINSNPGQDRAQFYPWVTVDQSTHRVHVIWYDQDPVATGDTTELMHTFSTDSGATWSPPTPLFDRPFRAGFGNDTSQPNVGDYQQTVAQAGTLHTVTAWNPPEVQFDEGQQPTAGTQLFAPDVYYDALSNTTTVAALRLGTVSTSELFCVASSNGLIDPGELAGLTVALENYVGNPNNAPTTYTSVQATLTSATPGVTVYNSSQLYADIAPLTSVSNVEPFQVYVGPQVAPGSAVELLLSVSTDQGTIELPYRMRVGTPDASTTLLSEDFESVTVPALPAGWSSNFGGGSNVPWVTNATFTGSQAAFHPNQTTTKFMRLFSPAINIPGVSGPAVPYVTLDFNIAYRTEIDLVQQVLAYDGLTVRLTDLTTGATLRSVLAEAFAEELTTGAINHFPRHLPRSSNTSYFQDMSVWAGDSNGVIHVRMRFPGTGMAGRSVQLRFEYTEDGSADCTASGMAAPCGVAVDNVVMRLVQPVSSGCTLLNAPADVALLKQAAVDQAFPGAPITYTLAYSNTGPFTATNVLITDTLPLELTNPQYASSGAVITSLGGLAYRWSVADLAPGSGGLITITGMLSDAAALEPLTNTATIGSTNDDPNLENNSSTAVVQITDAPISALAASSSSPDVLGTTTQLTATLSSGSSVTYTWSFGDGSSGSGATPTHVYGAVGSYTATVTATNSAGSSSASTQVEIVDAPISGLAASSSSPDVLGTTTQLTATLSSGSSVTYTWSFGDGTSGSGATPTHVYGAVGSYTATVTATNSVSSQSATVVVEITPTTTGHRLYIPLLLKSSAVVAQHPELKTFLFWMR